ncbi:hypothetical protein L227DRAFT_616957 [Lentinus tigrinus ALCF2SS1-6]|uniref:Uncharacterized protein n=1 Tax=Lentinus tigrinus ALCF2SS1-6 TaxID=1328759 RepID=A0A5C2RQK8_9APHY|nr:hypothetical protein L227DRAFT_616957 [Lentinus tigrinus ALCF2SS1-6]
MFGLGSASLSGVTASLSHHPPAPQLESMLSSVRNYLFRILYCPTSETIPLRTLLRLSGDQPREWDPTFEDYYALLLERDPDMSPFFLYFGFSTHSQRPRTQRCAKLFQCCIAKVEMSAMSTDTSDWVGTSLLMTIVTDDHTTGRTRLAGALKLECTAEPRSNPPRRDQDTDGTAEEVVSNAAPAAVAAAAAHESTPRAAQPTFVFRHRVRMYNRPPPMTRAGGETILFRYTFPRRRRFDRPDLTRVSAAVTSIQERLRQQGPDAPGEGEGDAEEVLMRTYWFAALMFCVLAGREGDDTRLCRRCSSGSERPEIGSKSRPLRENARGFEGGGENLMCRFEDDQEAGKGVHDKGEVFGQFVVAAGVRASHRASPE